MKKYDYASAATIVAIPLATAELVTTIAIACVPYPRIRLTQQIIKKLEKSVGVGPYMASFYIVVKIKSQDFNKLNALWNLKMYDDCDEIISKYTPNFHSLQSALLEENNV